MGTSSTTNSRVRAKSRYENPLWTRDTQEVYFRGTLYEILESNLWALAVAAGSLCLTR